MVSIETYLQAIKTVAYDGIYVRIGSFDQMKIDAHLSQIILEIRKDAIKDYLYDRDAKK